MRDGIAFVVLCTAVYLLTAPGRILFPDDEIVFQTTRSLYEDRSLEIEGIARRTGEPRGRPDGTFGWAQGRGGARYGFFGHALSLVAMPAYGLGKLAAAQAPEAWRHAIRSDHFSMHERSAQGDWTRLVVSLTNTVVTALAGWMLVAWLLALKFGRRPAVLTGLAYALGTTAWPYSGTFLSEPLSALVFATTAWAIARFHERMGERAADDPAPWLWLAGMLVGVSVHVHILNIVAAPCFAAYALWPIWRAGRLRAERWAWGGAVLLAAAGLAVLGYGHFIRFGDPFETGRYGLYSHFVVPGEGVVATVVSPGRSLLLYSPPIVLALLGWRRAARRVPVAAAFALGVIVTRWLFIAARSDWWGGWAIGPRFLVPVVPFALLGLVAALEVAGSRRRWIPLTVGLAASVVLQAHLASHSIFEWMLEVYKTTPDAVSYLARSHWAWTASPIHGFASLPPNSLFAGAVRLAQQGHAGLLWLFVAIGAAGLGAAGLLVGGLWRRPSLLHGER